MTTHYSIPADVIPWLLPDATLAAMLDVLPHDPYPDRCWRCDASPATTDVGCCRWCLDSLRKGTAP